MGGSAVFVFGKGFFQSFQSFGRIVKVWDRFVESGAVKINQITLELPETLGNIKCLTFIFQNFIGSGIFNKNVTSPVISLTVDHIRFIVCRPQENDGTFAGGGIGFAYLFPDVPGDSVNIFHDKVRTFENKGIDPLQSVMQPYAALIVSYLISVIDVT
jgi:hypothetical protein